MKILTVCNGGNCRSVTLASMIKQEGVEAIPIGLRTNTTKTIKMLGRWADVVIVLADNHMLDRLPNGLKKKVIYMNIGKDEWEQAMHPELVKRISKALKKTSLKHLKIRVRLEAS